MIQSTKGRVSALKAIAVIAACVAGLYLVNFALEKLVESGTLSYTAGLICMWVFTVLLFVFVLRRFCLAGVYELDGVKLTFSRIYLRRPRLEEQIMLREVVFFGSPVDAARKYNTGLTRRFVSSRSPYAVQALVYKRGGGYKKILFNPNEEICAGIVKALDR